MHAGHGGSAFSDTWEFGWAVADQPGDLNCDCALDSFDIEPFILALVDPIGYGKAHPTCWRKLADTNADGRIDGFDIEPFVELLVGP
jgi:hypothetical protein